MIMGSIIKAKRTIRARVVTQWAALGLFNLHFLSLRSVCAPVLNCHSCPLAVFACPVGVLVNFSALRLLPFITLGVLGLAGALGGRFVCGWLCPFGLLQDWAKKIRSRNASLSRRFVYLKYALLAGLVFAVPFFLPKSTYAFCNLCPAGTLESAIPWAIMGLSSPWRWSFGLRAALLLGTVVLAIAVSRGFCRTLCPLGAILGVFNKVSLLRLRLAKEDCNHCGACARRCPVGIDPARQINHPECIRCLECTRTGHLQLGPR
jgi:polyferredoxin